MSIMCLPQQSRILCRNITYGYVQQAKPLALAELESTRIPIDRFEENEAANSKCVIGCKDVFLHILNNMGPTRLKLRSLSAPYSLPAARLRLLPHAQPDRCKIKGQISSFGRSMPLLAFQRHRDS